MNNNPPTKLVGAQLSLEQRDTIEDWLFKEKLPQDEIIELCSRKLNLAFSPEALMEFERASRPGPTRRRAARSANGVNEVTGRFTEEPADTYSLLLTMAGQLAFERTVKSTTNRDRRVIMDFTKLLISARRDDRDVESRQFAREKWEFDVSEACLEKLPELKSISTDNALNQKEKLKRIRLRLFGVAPE